ncbi:hypothetical protein AKJ09_08754 [Labilithrix luteola]|uniref:Lipoprotein n=2 Tax=Labilithrix luteola TaxID=1391654 RepID=A0A0K1Q8F4_9BACT|nr:hypothetical protein AKJ09_08754 [Labilithrix luteola]
MGKAGRVGIVTTTVLLVGCAGRKAAEAPSASAPAQAGYAEAAPPGAYPSSPSAYPQQAQAGAALPSSIAPGRPAVQAAARDLDASQRELDVAAGDCHNACRALGSMDRAAGHLCALVQGDDDVRRCEDAKTRVYSARSRVKNTCGACEGGPSVERNDPIPSTK